MDKRLWTTLGLLGLLVAFASSTVSAQSRQKSTALDSSETTQMVDVKFQIDGRYSATQTWSVPVAWEKYEAVEINIGESPASYTPAFAFDYRGDKVKIDFRNEDFKTPDGFGQGNIADPRPVKDLEKAFARARRDILMQYRIWLSDRREPVGIILTPYLIKVTRIDNRIVVKLTDEALRERDVKIKY